MVHYDLNIFFVRSSTRWGWRWESITNGWTRQSIIREYLRMLPPLVHGYSGLWMKTLKALTALKIPSTSVNCGIVGQTFTATSLISTTPNLKIVVCFDIARLWHCQLNSHDDQHRNDWQLCLFGMRSKIPRANSYASPTFYCTHPWYSRPFLVTISTVSVMANFIELSSHITGYHVYQAEWVPTVGKILLEEREPDNVEDHHAVCVRKDGRLVGHLERGDSGRFAQLKNSPQIPPKKPRPPILKSSGNPDIDPSNAPSSGTVPFWS